MPDGSTFDRQIAITSSQTSTPAPVAAGLVREYEWVALQRHFAAMRSSKPTRGPADFIALRARATLHAWVGSAFTMPCYPDSVRFWELVAFFEREWIKKRRGQRRRPHEKAAEALLARGHELSDATSEYFKVSRFRRSLAVKTGDHRLVAQIDAFPRDRRRALVLEARRERRPALRAFFEAVGTYRARRAIHARVADHGTHMTRAPDARMEPRYYQGEWLGIARCWRPRKGDDVFFVDNQGHMLLAHVLGWSADAWRVGQFRGQSQPKVRQLSREDWRPTWRVLTRCCCEDGNAYYDAVALGMTDRAKTIQLAIGGRTEMPPPLTTEQRRTIPSIVKSS